MSSITNDAIQARVAEILYERENSKRLEEERRIQIEIDTEARRALAEAEHAEKRRLEEERRIQFEIEAAARRVIIEAEIAEKRRLEEEKRIQVEIDRAAIAQIVTVKREDIKKKQEEIEFYRQEIIRVQTDISKINSEIISFNHTPSSPMNIPNSDTGIRDSHSSFKGSELGHSDIDEDYIIQHLRADNGSMYEKKKTWRGFEYEVDNSESIISKINTLNNSLKAIVTIIRNNGKLTLHKLKEFVNKDESIASVIRDNIVDTPLSKIIQNKMKMLVVMEILKPNN